MRIAVVVASLKRPEEIGQLLAALRRQTMQPCATILSVSAPSDVPEAVPPGVEIIMGGAGLTAQRNRGLELVLDRCDAVVFFDDDFIPAKSSLQGIAMLFETHPEVVGSTGLVLHDGVKLGGTSHDDALRIVRDYEAAPQAPFRNEDILFAYGCNMAFRTSAIGDLRFDENLPLSGWQEDMDFAARIASRGKVIRTTAFAGVHRGVNKGRSSGLAFGFSQVINPAYLVRKGAMRPKKAMTLMARNIIANHIRVFRPEPFIDRVGRIRGNWLGFMHLIRGKIDPTAILTLK